MEFVVDQDIRFIASRLVAERAHRPDVVAPGRMIVLSSGERACVGLSVFA